MSAGTPQPNQFALLGQRRFAPFFWTQFLGAANDNVFKFAFTLMITYQLQLDWLPPSHAGLVIGALFILPYVLFSATSGQLADKHDKARLMQLVKSLEIAIMALAAWGLYAAHVPTLLACVFLMGLHSTLFGPVKYAYLPQHLSERELTGGNGMVEMGTFVAILLGQLAGGLLVDTPVVGPQHVAWAGLVLAALGRWSAQAIPFSPPTDPTLAINWNPFTETWRNLKLAREEPVVFRSLLGISWMWFFGAVFLSNFPAFAKEVLHGGPQVASLLLAVFSVGIGVGSLLCELLSRRQVEIGLVPLGAIGMSVFAIDLHAAATGLPASAPYSVPAFLAVAAHWRVLADLALLALFAGLYSVPMYALIQLRAQATHRARIIAANNILNAVFMIASSVIAGAMLSAGLTIPQIFLAVGIANALVSASLCLIVPEYGLRFIAFVLTRLVYRFRVVDGQRLPTSGAAVLVCNRASLVDALLLTAASPRPIRFLLDQQRFQTPVLGRLFRRAQALPIASHEADPASHEAAFAAARAVLADGEMVCIMAPGGVMKLLDGAGELPVIPLTLGPARDALDARADSGQAMLKPLRRGLRSRVSLTVGAPLRASEASPSALRERIAAMLD